MLYPLTKEIIPIKKAIPLHTQRVVDSLPKFIVITIETIMYSANRLNYKLIQEEDGWWSIYRQNKYTNEYEPVIQAKTLGKAKDYCDLTEPIVVPLKEI